MRSRQFPFWKRCRSHENLESLVISRGVGYPIQGQYYVNIDILQTRGAISLDEDGWTRVLSDIIDDGHRNTGVSKAGDRTRINKRKGVHSYVREYFIASKPKGYIRDRVEVAPLKTKDIATSKGSNKKTNKSSVSLRLLRSLSMFKHRFKDPKERIKGLLKAYRSEEDLTPETGEQEWHDNPQCRVENKPHQHYTNSDRGLHFTESNNNIYTSHQFCGKEVTKHQANIPFTQMSSNVGISKEVTKHQANIPFTQMSSNVGISKEVTKHQANIPFTQMSSNVGISKEPTVMSPSHNTQTMQTFPSHRKCVEERQSANISRADDNERRQINEEIPVSGDVKSSDIVAAHPSPQQRLQLDRTDHIQNFRCGSNDGGCVKGFRNSSLRRQPVFKGPSTEKQRRFQSAGSKPTRMLTVQSGSVNPSVVRSSVENDATRPVIVHHSLEVKQSKQRGVKNATIVGDIRFVSPPTYEVAIGGRNQSLSRKYPSGDVRSGNIKPPRDCIDSSESNSGAGPYQGGHTTRRIATDPTGDPPPYQRPIHRNYGSMPHSRRRGHSADRDETTYSAETMTTNSRSHNHPITNPLYMFIHTNTSGSEVKKEFDESDRSTVYHQRALDKRAPHETTKTDTLSKHQNHPFSSGISSATTHNQKGRKVVWETLV